MILFLFFRILRNWLHVQWTFTNLSQVAGAVKWTILFLKNADNANVLIDIFQQMDIIVSGFTHNPVYSAVQLHIAFFYG